MTTETTSQTQGGNSATPFDPAKHLITLKGKAYLEVVYRAMWFRTEHPEAAMTSKIEHLDMEKGTVVFSARVEIPGAGVAEGTGMETRDNFPEGWLEKAQTTAYGRALALLGYGTAFAVADFEEGRISDAPVQTPSTNGTPTTNGIAPARNGTSLATPAQLKLIYLCGTRDAHLTQEDVEDRCHAQYGRLPVQLTKREASEFIDALKAVAAARSK